MPGTTVVTSTGFYRSRQGYDRVTTHDISGTKVRVTMHRDSYDNQSRFYAEAFSTTDLRWNRIAWLPGEQFADMPSPYGSGVAVEDAMSEALDEVEELLLAEVSSLLA